MSARTGLFRMIAIAALILVGVACDAPPVIASADERQHSESARIEGRVVVTSAARGNVILSLFDASRPPPPDGTGRPISFVFIPAEELFGAAMDDPSRTGPFTAPYSFSLVPEGRYLIKGFLDREGCSDQWGCRKPDFNPWYGVTNEPGAGDVGGADVDASTKQIVVLDVHRDDSGQLVPITDAAVSFADSALVPVDRPAFDVSGIPVLDLSKPASLFELTPKKIDELSISSPMFLARWVDENGDGVPDDANSDGIPEFWPKVFVRKLADVPLPLLDENDVNHDGVIDEQGVDYEHADGTKDGKPDAVVLAAGFRPDTVASALMNEDGTPNMGAVPMPKLDLVIRPLALDARDPAHPVPLKTVPKGKYAVIVMQFTGQTWRVPNELQPAFASHAGLPQVDSQAYVIEVK